ncbi:putative suppressor of glycerol defect protein [Rosellinia necatrix]|uniref:Putative suppressor of glycerol defect protein n=1 Tax=Rosellinia necatrix TaxID=77044 RepID=A0A1W2TNA6_ROSNE|nr:putative suppressor of glycerol defect protein [Rosellinia necatrix]
MAPGTKRKLSLPSTLLQELNIQQGGPGRNKRQRSRKDQRKESRVQKRHARSSQFRRPTQPTHSSASHHKKSSQQPKDNGLPFSSDDELDEDDFDVDDEGIEEEEGEMDSDESEEIESRQPTKPKLSKSDTAKIAQDEKEIAKLEKRLGLKGKRKLPKSFDEDGLGDLLEGLDGLDSDNDGKGSLSNNRRKTEADEWLAQKRRKAEAAATAANTVAIAASGNSDADSMDEDGFDDDESEEDADLLDLLDSEEDDVDGDSDGDDNFEGFSEADEKEEPVRPQRENPYVAPTTNVAKYVPPSLRKQSGPNDQVEAQLRRRIQGLINRLTNDSMTGIVKDITNLYQTNSRQLVTSTLVDLIMALVCSPEKRPDPFFTMIAGFIAAVHKTMGLAISAQFLQQIVETLEKRSVAASGDHSDAGSKHLVSLLAELYNMQVVGSNLIFDYIRLFLETLSELSTELLLRIIQLCGPSLRRDDPRVLRDIINRIPPTATKDTSVRTRFMIDEMKKLQSNKAKAAAKNKDLAEQRTQLRKQIGTLKGTHDVQPLRVGLKDIRDAETQGKWWLVGASWLGNQSGQGKEATNNDHGDEEGDGEEDLADETITYADDDLGIPDLWKLAREQGFNTEVRQRIFVALHAATDCEGADLLVQKLRLSRQQRREMAEVIVRSGERQNAYNHYYALLADRFGGADKEMRFQFRRCLTVRFKRMGEDVDTDGADDVMGEEDEQEAAGGGVRWLFNTAKLFGFLVAWGTLKLADVFKYRNLAALQERAHVFAEVLLLTVLQECKGAKLRDVFAGLGVDMDLGRGVQYFLQQHVRGPRLVDDKDKKAKKLVQRRCDEVLELLGSVLVQEDLE